MLELTNLNESIVGCDKCPRLREWCRQIALEKRKAYLDWNYWGRPVPNFGDPNAKRLIVGLAPAAHGANRTGRMFTGDRSGDWLYRALHKCGVANQPTAESRDDGLQLSGVLITAVCHCAPPDNKPTHSEINHCSGYLGELLSGRDWRSVLCLGSIAWLRVHRHYGIRTPRFGHGAESATPTGWPIIGCFHPSQQNTFTGRLTEEMLDRAIAKFLA